MPQNTCFYCSKAGGKDDPENNTGLAHYLQDIMFKGQIFRHKRLRKRKATSRFYENLFNKLKISNKRR